MESSETPDPQRETFAPSQRDGILYLPEGSALPTDICICSGRKATKVITKALRNPRNPKTWYSRQPCVKIGLSKKHCDDNNIGIALTLSVLVIGVAIFVAGLITLEMVSLIIGLLAILVSGFFRARGPIFSENPSADPLPIQGANQAYLQQFPELDLNLEDD
ncbi:MAG: hypothetical protein P1U58_19040 [Verrucomicrobiales bacterium]|nr:hypothetical protein [Verrucomicrobiales bacterium]